MALTLIAKSTPTTYQFRGEPFGWAYCTVNDATGELNIQSDWGNWAYRWSPDPKHLGYPTLTAFIAGREAVDYIANKLQREGHSGRRWSGPATARALQRLLLERRIESGRHRPRFARYRGRILDRDLARILYDTLGELGDELDGSADLFYDRILRIEDFAEFITSEPWDYEVTEQTPEDKALREVVLPALIRACQSPRPRVIRVPLACGRTMEVEATEKFGEWAVHPLVVEFGKLSTTNWTVTHAPTGLRLKIQKDLDEGAAIAVASALMADIPAGCLTSAVVPDELAGKIGATVRGVLWPAEEP